MNELDKKYEHEDAFMAANRHAEGIVNLSRLLRQCVGTDIELADKAVLIIANARIQHAELFSAFIAGVDFGRKNPT